MTKFVVRSMFKLIQYYWKFHLQCHCKGLCRIQNALNLTQHYTCHLEFTKLFELTTWVATSCNMPIYLMGPYQMPIKNNPNFCIVSQLVLHCKEHWTPGLHVLGWFLPWKFCFIQYLPIFFWWMGTAHNQFPQSSSENMLKHISIPDFWNGRDLSISTL